MRKLFRICLRAILSIKLIRAIIIYLVSRVTHKRKGMSDRLVSLIPLSTQSDIPWTRNTIPLAESKIALITTAGLYVKGQAPFREGSLFGDFRYRTIDRDIAPSQISVSKYMVDKRWVLLDPNMVFPISRLMKLREKRVIRDVAQNHYSFYSHALDTSRILDGSAKDVARRLRYEGVDKALVLTSSIQSQEMAILIQRSIEKEGIPTVSLSYTMEAIKELKPPRTCLLTKGSLFRLEEYLDEDVQMNLVKFMLSQFSNINEPGDYKKVVMEALSSVRGDETEPAQAMAGYQKDLFL